MTFSNALNEMANKARKGVTEIFGTLWRLGDFSAPIFFKMFDAQIKPMLLYGSEFWGGGWRSTSQWRKFTHFPSKSF